MTLLLPVPCRDLQDIDVAVFTAGLVPGRWQPLPLWHDGCGGVWQVSRRVEVDGWPSVWGWVRCSKCPACRPIRFPESGRPAMHIDS